MIVGVDNGLDGGLCAIAQFDGSLIDKIAMPCQRRSKKREIDICKIHQWLSDLNTSFVLAIEEPLHMRKARRRCANGDLVREVVGDGRVQRLRGCASSVHKWQKKMLGFISRKNQRSSS